jgi:ferredoxin
LTVAVYPVFSFLSNGIFNFLFHLGWGEDQVYTVFNYAQSVLLPITQPRFFHAGAICAVLGIILALGLVTRRFWCRNLCPLGALLGISAKFRIMKRTVSDACTQCGICQRDCKMNAIEDDYTVNSTVECIECAECVAVCPPRAVSYQLGKNRGENKIDITRRRVLQSAFAGLAGLSLIKVTGISRTKAGSLIRPPGSVTEDEFLDRCIRCHECSRICATTGACLQPSATEGGVESFWTPVAVPRSGYCEYSCNLCGQVCPTGAIQNLPLDQKQGQKMGLAFFDKSRCIPWYSQQDCLVCEEHCPTPEKAIKFDIREARAPDGTMRLVKFPYVVDQRCIGCGICENKCPVIGAPGIYVTNAGEQRVTKGV